MDVRFWIFWLVVSLALFVVNAVRERTFWAVIWFLVIILSGVGIGVGL